MNPNLESRILRHLHSFDSLSQDLRSCSTSLTTAQSEMDQVLLTQDLLERAVVTLSLVKPLLTASSITQCEALANSALRSVFNLDCTVTWDPESQRFLLHKGDLITDLAESEGGGLTTVVSFVFSVYLLVKLGRRRFLAFDEAFYGVSAEYFPAFLSFVHQVCTDLHIDLLLISHDARIDHSLLDHVYELKDGVTRKLK